MFNFIWLDVLQSIQEGLFLSFLLVLAIFSLITQIKVGLCLIPCFLSSFRYSWSLSCKVGCRLVPEWPDRLCRDCLEHLHGSISDDLILSHEAFNFLRSAPLHFLNAIGSLSDASHFLLIRAVGAPVLSL